MIVKMNSEDGRNTKEIVGSRLKGLLRRAIKAGTYNSQEDFFSDIGGEEGTTKDTFSKYLSGKNSIPLEKFKEICEKLDCSADYLLGLTSFNKSFSGIGSTLIKLGYSIEEDPYESDYITISKDNISFTCTYQEIEKEFDDILSFIMFKSQK